MPESSPGVPIERPSVETRPYREATLAGYGIGIVVGILLTVSMTYTGLKLGFTVPASAMAAIVGLGVLRGLMRIGSIVENNINQTVASAINITCSGVIFTMPVLYLRGETPNLLSITLAAVAGSFLGTVFIVPLRKQMIDLERLRFPTGYATATILKAAGGGKRALLLLFGSIVGFSLYFAIRFAIRPEGEPLPNEAEASYAGIFSFLGFRIPAYTTPVIELSITGLAAGFIAGRFAIVVIFGGMLASWVVAPALVHFGWLPQGVAAADAAVPIRKINRELGIGLLVGGAVAGVLMAAPMIKAAFASLSRKGPAGAKAQELSVGLIVVAALLSFAVVALAGNLGGLPWETALVCGAVASFWIWLAGVIVAQTTGVTDWSPISGMSLIGIAALLAIAGKAAVPVCVTMGCAMAVAMSQAADMMQDLKTGHLVGAVPRKQQVAQLWVAWIGPAVSIVTLTALFTAARKDYASNPLFQEEVRALAASEEVVTEATPPEKVEPLREGKAFQKRFAAPQAGAIDGAIQAVTGAGSADIFTRYGIGALLGLALTFAAGGGLGVQVGLSMYLKLSTLLPFGIGCLLSVLVEKRLGKKALEEFFIPVVAGLLVGDSLAGVGQSFHGIGWDGFKEMFRTMVGG
ncbi:MAG TPA: OPT/YSL family transporter [Planctomycetota bacterium]|jgi:putative OPT family oligopeptide transporter|nr:OPT/YSL family transporter [Planctomycetota bacterium]